MNGIVGIEGKLPEYDLFCLANDKGEVVMRCKRDGSVIFGPGFTTNEEAARLFWNCIGSAVPLMLLKTAEKVRAACVAAVHERGRQEGMWDYAAELASLVEKLDLVKVLEVP